MYCSSLPEEPQQSIRWMLNAPCLLFLQLILFCSTLHPGLSAHMDQTVVAGRFGDPTRMRQEWASVSFQWSSDALIDQREANNFKHCHGLMVGGSQQMHRPDRQLPPRYVLYTHLGLVRGNGGGGVYDVIKKCQKRSAWEQVVCGAAAIKDSYSFHSLPQMVTPQTEHCWLGAHMNAAQNTHVHIIFLI